MRRKAASVALHDVLPLQRRTISMDIDGPESPASTPARSPAYLSTSEVALALGLHRATVRSLVRRRVDPGIYRPAERPARTDYERSSCPRCQSPLLNRVSQTPPVVRPGERSLRDRLAELWWRTRTVRAVLAFLGGVGFIVVCAWAWLQMIWIGP